jgi:hypothetical protein
VDDGELFASKACPVMTIDEQLQSLYHFTVGLPLDDPRIETSLTDDISRPGGD